MMKFATQSLAAAVSLALMSVSAHAALTAPAIGSTAPSDQTTLYLSVWDANGNNSESVNLSYTYNQITLGSGNLTPAGAPFTTAVNPATNVGNVAQLNFGVIPGFSSLFTSANLATTDYMVTAATSGGAGQEGAEVTSTSTPVTAYSAVNGLVSNVQGQIAAWQGAPTASTAGYVTDTTGSPAYSVQGTSGSLAGGQLVSGQQFGGSVGQSLNFYNMTTTSAHKAVNTAYSGFWYLSTSGDLTYNVVSSSAPVPLPAAVWLLGSGLLGMAGIARRRRNAG